MKSKEIKKEKALIHSKVKPVVVKHVLNDNFI
jgi:hypothetical protein